MPPRHSKSRSKAVVPLNIAPTPPSSTPPSPKPRRHSAIFRSFWAPISIVVLNLAVTSLLWASPIPLPLFLSLAFFLCSLAVFIISFDRFVCTELISGTPGDAVLLVPYTSYRATLNAIDWYVIFFHVIVFSVAVIITIALIFSVDCSTVERLRFPSLPSPL